MFFKRKHNKSLTINKVNKQSVAVDAHASVGFSGGSSIHPDQEESVIFDLTKPAFGDHSFDTAQAWNNLQQRIAAEESRETRFVAHASPRRKISLIPALLKIAAVVVIALAGYYMFDSQTAPKQIELVAEASVNETITLSDGSVVYLRKGARITYPEQFNENDRQVSFEGEAFFEIAVNPEKPFRITAGNVGVEVLGTSFNLNARPENKKIILSLHTGKVLFYSIDPVSGDVFEQIVLEPGQAGVFQPETGTLKRESFSSNNHLAWKTGIIEFADTPLCEVFASLSEYYGVNMVCDNPNLTELKLSATFENEPVESVLETINLIFGLESEQNDNGIQFK